MEEYKFRLFTMIQNDSKKVKENVLSALYEMGKDGDFTRLGINRIDSLLEEILYHEEMSDFIGELYENLRIALRM